MKNGTTPNQQNDDTTYLPKSDKRAVLTTGFSRGPDIGLATLNRQYEGWDDIFNYCSADHGMQLNAEKSIIIHTRSIPTDDERYAVLDANMLCADRR